MTSEPAPTSNGCAEESPSESPALGETAEGLPPVETVLDRSDAEPEPMMGPRSGPSAPQVGIPRALRRWDRYEVLEILGTGGMGAVYKARDPRLHRLIALKIIHPMLGQGVSRGGQMFIKRFVREARLQASLEHPHICKILGCCRNSDGIA